MGEICTGEVFQAPAVMEAWADETARMIVSLGIEADERTPQRIARYHAMLADRNTYMNLTGDTDFSLSLDRHYADSVAPLAYRDLFPEGASLIDVGSGAGFPGLPLAIARPDLKVTLLDSLAKRVAFLSDVAQALGLSNVTVIHSRAEDGGRKPEMRDSFQIAVARAVAPLPVLCELLLPFVREGGHMICYKGPAAREETEAGERAAFALGAGKLSMREVHLPSQPEWQHCLLISRKQKPTPKAYPRKAGTPSRMPLGMPMKKA